MKRSKTTDGHSYTAAAVAPFSKTLANMAALIPGEKLKRWRGKPAGCKNSAKRRFTADEVRELRRRHAAGVDALALRQETGLSKSGMRSLLEGATYGWVI